MRGHPRANGSASGGNWLSTYPQARSPPPRTPPPLPPPDFTRRGGLTTNGIHATLPASLSNGSGPPQKTLAWRGDDAVDAEEEEVVE